MRQRRGWNIRSASPSKGKKRFTISHKGHKPSNVLVIEKRSEKINRMLKVLTHGGWEFKFKLEAISPRGFRYQAEGSSGEEVFMKAFGQWKSDLITPDTVTPTSSTLSLKTPEPNKKPKMHTADLVHELMDRYGRPNIAQPIYRKYLDDPETVNDSKSYRRLYMRAYRAQKRLALAA